jgi:hypothetical protein
MPFTYGAEVVDVHVDVLVHVLVLVAGDRRFEQPLLAARFVQRTQSATYI